MREQSNPGGVADQAGAEALVDGGLGKHGGAGELGLDSDVNGKAIGMELCICQSIHRRKTGCEILQYKCTADERSNLGNGQKGHRLKSQ